MLDHLIKTNKQLIYKFGVARMKCIFVYCYGHMQCNHPQEQKLTLHMMINHLSSETLTWSFSPLCSEGGGTGLRVSFASPRSSSGYRPKRE